jgi:hypothetical protein
MGRVEIVVFEFSELVVLESVKSKIYYYFSDQQTTIIYFLSKLIAPACLANPGGRRQ